MQLLYFVLLTCLVSSLRGKAMHRKGCYECEEEVWEKVPCDGIPSNKTNAATTDISPALKPVIPIPKATTQQISLSVPSLRTTPSPQTTPYSTTKSPELVTAADPYNKCYTECKLSCKEFCRKCIASPFEKQIVQVSKISEPVQNGHIQSTHILQRELIPNLSKNCVNNNDCLQSVVNKPAGENFLTPQTLPAPVLPRVEYKSTIDSGVYAPYHNKLNIPSESYNSKPFLTPINPIYGPPATPQMGANNIQSFNSYPSNAQYPAYNHPLNSADNSNFPIPFENAFSKVSKTLLDPIQGIQISLDASSGNTGNPIVTSYSSPARVIDSQLETSFDNFDDPFDSFLSQNPSNEPRHDAYSKPFYSVSYNIM